MDWHKFWHGVSREEKIRREEEFNTVNRYVQHFNVRVFADNMYKTLSAKVVWEDKFFDELKWQVFPDKYWSELLENATKKGITLEGKWYPPHTIQYIERTASEHTSWQRTWED